jgi:hypothetical protein
MLIQSVIVRRKLELNPVAAEQAAASARRMGAAAAPILPPAQVLENEDMTEYYADAAQLSRPAAG